MQFGEDETPPRKDPHLSADQLRAWLESKLPPGGETTVESHLEECDTCAEVLESLHPPTAPLVERMRELNVDFPVAGTDRQRYDLGDEIARGGMGVVLRAFDNNIRRDVAIKVLRNDGRENAEIVGRFHQEAQIGGQLQHPGIAPVYEIGRLPDGRRFIAMKLVKGKTLADLLAHGQDAAGDQAKFLGIFEQVCQAMAFAHTRDVIHRDLKPANVMVGEFGEVQVMDWGLAKLVGDEQSAATIDEASDEATGDATAVKPSSIDVATAISGHHTRLGQAMGTPGYMAPEQYQGGADKPADVFALGAILCEILTGELISTNLDAARERLDQCQGDEAVVQLAKDCLQRNQADRPHNAGAVAARISAHLNAIQQRLKEADIATARAKMEAEEERRRRQRTVRTVALAATVLVIVAGSAVLIRNAMIERQQSDRARGQVETLLVADTTRVPAIIENMKFYRDWTDPLLRESFARSKHGSRERLHAALALLPVDPSKRDYLREQLDQVTPHEFPVVRDALRPHQAKINGPLWDVALNEQRAAASRFQAAASLAAYTPDDERWNEISPFIAKYLTGNVSSVDFGDWLRHFRPAGEQLAESLAALQADRDLSLARREAAAQALADYCHERPDRLTDAILIADTSAEFTPLIAALRTHSENVKQQLVDEMHAAMPENPTTDQRDAHWKRKSIAAVTLAQLGFGEMVWPMLAFTPDPSLRSFIIEHLGKLGTDHNALAARLRAEDDVSIRRALIQALGGLEVGQVSVADRDRIASLLRQLYVTDPDPGIHGSASWALRQWDLPLPELPVGEHGGGPRWYVNSQGQTMVLMSLALASGDDDVASGDDEVDHTLAIASREVTLTEYQRFRGVYDGVDRRLTPTDDCPAPGISWYMAAEYCNWLSEQEGIPKDQWVFEPTSNGEYAEGMNVAENFRQLRGYRLPTLREWEVACRAGTTSEYGFGEPVPLLHKYGRSIMSFAPASQPVGSLLPNDAGLFDMHGNLLEWTMGEVPGPLSPVRNNRLRGLCGGMFTDRPENVRSTYNNFSNFPNAHDVTYGIRLIRTHP